MIKKILWLMIVLFSCIWFSNATLSTVWLIKYPSSVNNQYDVWFLRGGAFLSQFLWQSKSILALDTDRLAWWDNTWFLYVYLKSKNRAHDVQWYYDRFYSCDELTWDALPSNCSAMLITYSWDTQYFKEIFKWFFRSVSENDLVYYNYFNNQYIGATYDYNNNWLNICWSSSSLWKSLCFMGWYCYNEYQVCQWSLINSKGFADWLNFGLLPTSEIWYAPWQAQYDTNWFIPWDWDTFWSWNTEIIPSDVENYIKYFEDLYWRRESMCYVWVWDSYLDVPYWSGGISFAEWRGATIFWLYYHLYNTFWDDIVYNVWSFINAWTNNLYNTYKSDPYYIQYNGPWDNTTVIYSWSFPFLNNPVAIYFMADNLNSYDNTENNWQGVAVYCNIKLNKDNYENWSLDFNDFEELIPDYMKNNVNNYTNTSVGWKDWYSTPDLWSGSIWWNLVQSWYNIPKDLNPTELFSDFYWKINWLITNFNPAVRDWLIPLWIIYPMLFLILFRIMRH